MADWSELKRLAEEAQPTFGSFDPSEAEFDFMSAITPDVVLALIAENEQLTGIIRSRVVHILVGQDDQRQMDELVALGIEQDKREIERLRAEVEALRRDAERYRWLRSAENDVAITFGTHAWEDLSDEYMDAAIDAAMGKGGRADA